jgi:CoA:oxalate CoA-transferase
LGYAQAKALKPDIVYCSVSGYGQSGPLRDWPAIDNIVQATSGMMSLGGEPGDPPMRVGFPVVDTLTGQTAAFAILAALLKRQRGGQGEYIDVAMMDASLAFMASAVVPFLVTGRPMERTGNTGYSGQPTAALFEAADGNLISLGVVQQSQFEALARLLGHEEWLIDRRFTTPDLRRANAAVLQALLSEVLRQRPAAVWEQLLSSAGVPCGMVRDVAQASALPHLEQRGIKIPLKVAGLPLGDRVEILNAGFLFENDGPTVSDPPPAQGQHTEELLRWLGFDAGQRAEILQHS